VTCTSPGSDLRSGAATFPRVRRSAGRATRPGCDRAEAWRASTAALPRRAGRAGPDSAIGAGRVSGTARRSLPPTGKRTGSFTRPLGV
jgi:hypothetical protein